MFKNNKNTAIALVCVIFILLSVLCFTHLSGFFAGGFWGSHENGITFTASDSENSETFMSSGGGSSEKDEAAGESGGSASSELEKGEIAVYLCGAIKHPGVYRLQAGARVCDAVKAAGGLKSTASLTAVNQARELSDGEQIEFPTKKKEKNQGAVDDKKDGASAGDVKTHGGGVSPALVNINSADAAELMTLPGIGESRAQSIVMYRTEHGLFAGVKDIMNVTGIKDGIFQKIKDYITV